MADRSKSTPAGANPPEQGGVWIEYWSLAQLLEMMRADNPKDHDLGMIHESMNKHGWRGAVMIDERAQQLQVGHGRLTVLAQKKESGESAPAGVQDRGDDWYVPVLRGEAWRSDADARTYVTMDNQAAIAGGWNDPLLAEFLQATLADQGDLTGTGFDTDDLDALIASLNGESRDGGGGAAPPTPPDEFSSFDDETIPTEHTCPQCGYKWSGGK